MKKVLFIMKYLIGDKKDNLYTKFSGQIEAVEKLGYDVWFTALDKNDIYLCNKREKIKIGYVVSNKGKVKILEQANFYNNFYKVICHHIKQINVNFEYSYIRNMFFCPNSVKLLKYLFKSNVKIVMEVPTHPAKNEYKRNSNVLLKYSLLIQHALTKVHSKYINLYTLIGEPINGKYFGCKAINIQNGIQIESVPAKKKTEIDREIHVLALATMAKWHGYDRLIKGMNDYYKNGGMEDIIVHMVGNDGDGSLRSWKQLVQDLNLNDRYIFEGYKTGKELQEIVNKCDIAISSLGLFRKEMNVAAELKTREYMARGIPFVYSVQDQMLENARRFCYKVDNSNLNINIVEVINFVYTVRNDKNIINDMRKFAKDNMSWENQFSKIIRNVGDYDADSYDCFK